MAGSRAADESAAADLSDAELVTQTLRGDSQAFEVLMRRHYDAVWRTAITSS